MLNISMAQANFLSSQMETLNSVLSLVESFRAFDADNDGSINASELKGIMSSLGYNPSDQEVRSMMQQGDTNKDGLLSMEEFLQMNTKDMDLGNLTSSFRSVFDDLDIDENEVLTGDELHGLMENLGVDVSLEDCQDIISSMDADGDGAVSFEDFKLIIDSLT